MNTNDTEYIRKKWDESTLDKRIENLKKIIPEFEINITYSNYKNATDSDYDAKMLTYYFLKRKYSKIDASVFGRLKEVDYKPRLLTIDYDVSSDIYYRYYTTANCATTSYVYNPFECTYTVTPF